MSANPNNQDINPFAPQEDFQIFEDNPEDTNASQNMGEDDANEAVMREWPGTRFTPINPPAREVRAAARTPTPPDTEAPPTPAAPSTSRAGVYFDREIRLRARTGQVAVREGDFDGVDAWLAPDWPVERMTPMDRHVRRNILIRDARNRVARRPSALAPGGVPIGAGARDTSPTPAPRGRRAGGEGAGVSTAAPRRGREVAPAVPPRPAGARALGEVRVPPMSMAQLIAQLGMSTMNDFAADGDDERSDAGRNPRRAINTAAQISVHPRRDYRENFPESRTLVAPPQPAWGRANLQARGISTYDSDNGNWNIYGFGTGGHRDNHFNPGWAGYHDAQTWSTSVPTVAHPRHVNIQDVQSRHQAGFVEADQAQIHAHQYPEEEE